MHKYIAAQLEGAGDEKLLLTCSFINRICPTRWAKLKEYIKLVGNQAEVSRLLGMPEGLAILNRIGLYIAATSRAHIMARLFEKDSSNCVVAVWGMLTLINTDNRVPALAVL